MECKKSIAGFPTHLETHPVSAGISSQRIGVRPKRPAVATLKVRAIQYSAPLSPSSSSSLYDVLSVPHDVSERDLKSAYRRMALRYHPDVCAPAEKEEATRMFVRVREAYETLSDPVLREDYDLRLQNGLELSDCDGRLRMNSNSLWEAQLVELMRRRIWNCYQADSWGSKMRRRNQQRTAASTTQ
uniref:J domain-containing protein n=1 Tax=Araucaria cunninghamii TaxID=56994 RepID=A0A0D6QSB5_ARACU